jgi:hypothetical protein
MGRRLEPLWTAEEDVKLTEAVKKHGTRWVAAAALVLARTELQCYQRWTMLLHRREALHASNVNGQHKKTRS